MNKRSVNQLIRSGDILAEFHRDNPSFDGRKFLASWVGERQSLVRSLSQCDARIATSAKQVVKNRIASAELRASASTRKSVVRIANPKKKKSTTVAGMPFGFVTDLKIEAEIFKRASSQVSNRLIQISRGMV